MVHFDAPNLKVLGVMIFKFFFPFQAIWNFYCVILGTEWRKKLITMSACIDMYFHTLVGMFLRMMAGVGITVSRSMTEKIQLEITFPYVLSSVLSTCVGHILFCLFVFLPFISTLISGAFTTFGLHSGT